MDTISWILLATVGLIILSIIVPKPGQGMKARHARINCLLDQAVRERDQREDNA